MPEHRRERDRRARGRRHVTYVPSTAPVVVDTDALPAFLPPELYVTVILVRRVGGVPHYRYRIVDGRL